WAVREWRLACTSRSTGAGEEPQGTRGHSHPVGGMVRTFGEDYAALPAHRSGSWRDVGPGREHYFPPVRVLVGDASVGLPVIDLGNRAGARGGEPGLHPLPGGSVRQVEHQLVQPTARVRCLPGTDDLQVNLTVWQPEDGPVQAIAVVEGLQDRQPDGVPVEGDRLLITRAPPHHP